MCCSSQGVAGDGCCVVGVDGLWGCFGEPCNPYPTAAGSPPHGQGRPRSTQPDGRWATVHLPGIQTSRRGLQQMEHRCFSMFSRFRSAGVEARNPMDLEDAVRPELQADSRGKAESARERETLGHITGRAYRSRGLSTSGLSRPPRRPLTQVVLPRRRRSGLRGHGVRQRGVRARPTATLTAVMCRKSPPIARHNKYKQLPIVATLLPVPRALVLQGNAGCGTVNRMRPPRRRVGEASRA